MREPLSESEMNRWGVVRETFERTTTGPDVGYVTMRMEKFDELRGVVERLRSHYYDRIRRDIQELNSVIAVKDARIKTLSDLNERLMENGNDLRKRAQKAEARITELEGWLVGERSLAIQQNPNRTREYSDEESLLAAHDQLLAEGKIGCGNHIVGANQMVLTAEQRKALRSALKLIHMDTEYQVSEEEELALRDILAGSGNLGYENRHLVMPPKDLIEPTPSGQLYWKATDDRIKAIRIALGYIPNWPGNGEVQSTRKKLWAMIEESKRDESRC